MEVNISAYDMAYVCVSLIYEESLKGWGWKLHACNYQFRMVAMFTYETLTHIPRNNEPV